MGSGSPLRGRCVVVTGGAGFIGSHIVDSALARGAAEVRILDNLWRGTRSNLRAAEATGRTAFVEGDIRDPDLVRTTISGADVVFHQAALRLPLCETDHRLADEVMVAGSREVLRACVDARVTRVVFASSAAVYGDAPTIPTPENTSFGEHQGVYGGAKAVIEEELARLHGRHGLRFVTLRYFNVYGPRSARRGDHLEVLTRWLVDVMEGRRPRVYGDGRQTSDFVYVDDVAAANMLAAEGPAVCGPVNVGTGIETSLARLATEMLHVLGRDEDPEFVDRPATNAVERRCADITRATRSLGFRARVGLEAGLRRTVAAWTDEPR